MQVIDYRPLVRSVLMFYRIDFVTKAALKLRGHTMTPKQNNATYIPYMPTTVIAKALFNFGVFGDANYRTRGSDIPPVVTAPDASVAPGQSVASVGVKFVFEIRPEGFL